MSPQPRPRQLRRRKALRLDHVALHDHDHAHLRGILLVAIVVAMAIGAFSRFEAFAPSAVSEADVSPAATRADAPDPVSISANANERDYLPLVTVAPEYPAAAQAAGIVGRCTVEFTVSAAGTTRDVRPVDCVPSGVFEASAVAAARQFKYRPRERDGQAVDAPGVRNEFLFSLDQ